MRQGIKDFAEEMEKVLQDNDFKGDLKEYNIQTLYNCLINEVGELKDLIEAKLIDQIDQHDNLQEYIRKIQMETIDMANYCMMIHQRLADKILFI